MMRLLACLLALGLAAPAALATPPQAEARPDHVADLKCFACHAEQASSWSDSKHRQAMQPATPDTVLGDFDDARFSGTGGRAHFLRRGDAFHVVTEGANGQALELPAAYTFGIRPLQQLLLPQPGGRLQAFTIAWDTRRKTWFSLYPEGGIEAGGNLHWTGRYQNWNLMCGECHTTAYRKGYDDAQDQYRTTWAESHVGCQACHGGGRAHAESARAMQANGGERPEPTANRALSQAHAQVDQCATCHSRRTRLVEEASAGAPLLDQFMPDNLRAELYHVDGQQSDEVFEYGSYRQSRMYEAGVACTDCHDPHSGKLRAEGDALCTACHGESPDRTRFPGLKPGKYDSATHHFHSPGKAGSRCVDCHMPSQNYMIVHGRRDHAIRIPRPDLSIKLGVPNACKDCHAERAPQWAAQAIARHFGARQNDTHYGEILAAARRREPGAQQRLERLVADNTQPAIVRATAVEALDELGTGTIPQLALQDPDPVVRATAAIALGNRTADERLDRLPDLLADPLRAVRIAAARGLADIDQSRLTPAQRIHVQSGLAAFVAAQQAMADMPSAQLNLAGLAVARRDPTGAERHYRRALAREPRLQAARTGLATLLAGSAREDEAERLLRDGLPLSTQAGELHFGLGLLAGQRKQWEKAAHELRAAAALMPGHPRVHRNLEAVERYLQQTR